MKRLSILMALIVLLGFANCARPKKAPEPKGQTAGPAKNITAEEYQIPDKLKEILPGLVNNKIRIWKEISPTVNLIAYEPNYSLDNAIKQAAQAFIVLTENPAFRNGIDFWIIQVQPEKGSEVMVWGVKPAEVDEYQKSNDLKAFFTNSEFVLINDQIIEKGDQRLKYLPATKEKK